MSESLLPYCRTRRDAKGTGEKQIWAVQSDARLAIYLDFIWHK
jgi:hypothetical protein